MPASTVAHDGQSRRRWPVWLLGARFVGAAVLVFVAYMLIVDWSRFTEAGIVGQLLESLSPDKVNADFARGEGLLIINTPGADIPLGAQVTRSCTVLTPIAVVTWVALCATRGSMVRRGLGLAISAVVLIAFDLVRIAAVIMAGATWGTSAMVLTHDWVGTCVTLVSLVLGLLVLWGTTGMSLRGRFRRSAAIPV